MKRLVEMIGAKTYYMFPEQWKDEQEAINEITEAYKDAETKMLFEVIAEWVFERYGQTVNMDID